MKCDVESENLHLGITRQGWLLPTELSIDGEIKQINKLHTQFCHRES